MSTKVKNIIIDYLFILVGAFALAVGVSCFLVPLKMSTGSTSGIAGMLFHLFDIPLSVTNLSINAILFLLGFKFLKFSSLVKTLVATILFSLLMDVVPYLGLTTDDIFMGSVLGGIGCGIGVGLTVCRDATTGGSDLAAMMVVKFFPHLNIATVILIMDASVMIISGIVFKSFTVTFYSVIGALVASKVTDWLLTSGKTAKSVSIVSPKSAEIAEAIMAKLDRGVTGIYSKGCYSKEDGMTLICVVKNKEIPKLIDIIEEYDKDAFTVISDAREVKGLGFNNL